MSNEFGFKGYAELRQPEVNVWKQGAMQFFFYCMAGLFAVLIAQTVWAVYSLAALFFNEPPISLYRQGR